MKFLLIFLLSFQVFATDIKELGDCKANIWLIGDDLKNACFLYHGLNTFEEYTLEQLESFNTCMDAWLNFVKDGFEVCEEEQKELLG